MAAPRKENVKDIIIDVTEQLLENRSIDDISLALIAKEAHISKGTLYYHYKAKEDILIDIIDRYLAKQWDDFIKWTENKEKDTSLHRLIKYVIERGVDFCDPRIHMIYNACIGNECIRDMVLERYENFQKIISAKIAERIDGVDADYISWLTLLITDGLVIHKKMGNDNIDIDMFIRKTEEYVKYFQSKER